MRKLLFLSFFSLFIVGCVATQPSFRDDFSGPSAFLCDSGSAVSFAKGEFFVLVAIDDSETKCSLDTTRNASYGQGPILSPQFIGRRVPARPMKVTLLATHSTAAPIHGIISWALGKFYRFKGDVDFEPKEGGHYIVKGELKKNGSAIWIEDTLTKERVTDKIIED